MVAEPAFADYARGSRWHQLILRHAGLDPDGPPKPLRPQTVAPGEAEAVRRVRRDDALRRAVRRISA